MVIRECKAGDTFQNHADQCQRRKIRRTEREKAPQIEKAPRARLEAVLNKQRPIRNILNPTLPTAVRTCYRIQFVGL